MAKTSAGRRNLVVGLGRTGLSCGRFLAAQGEDVVFVDSRAAPPGAAEAARILPAAQVHCGGFDVRALAGVTRLVVSPGVSLREPLVEAARAAGIEVLGDIELFARVARAPIVAITGSNGKSTVTRMVEGMMRGAGRAVLAGGNLGTPALDLLSAATEPDFYALELSSFQLELTASLHSAAATVLNVSADHMDRHADLATYARVKARIYRHSAVAVVNLDDDLARAMPDAATRRLSFSLRADSAADYVLRGQGEDAALARGAETLLHLDEFPLAGMHNAANALAALALAEAVGLPSADCVTALRRFRGLPHRSQMLARRDGIVWINDSKATNVGAAVAAISGLPGPLVLIAGGQGKGAEFAPLAKALAGKTRAAILIGEDAPLLERVLAGVCETRRAGDMDGAVALAHAIARSGDTVLLAPACASFDQFTDFAARGEAFARAVRERLS